MIARAAVSALGRDDASGAAAWALRLAFARVEADDRPPADWERVLSASAHERTVALAWHRSGSWIRGHAPAATIARWRTLAISSTMRGRVQWAALDAALHALDAAGIPVVTLKGLPLSQRLHGDPFVRAVADSDLYVPLEHRAAARGALAELGWRHEGGEAPWGEEWRLGDEPRPLHLELHSSLLDQNLAHLGEAPVDVEPVTIEGRAVPAHGGDLLPAYLASHLAKHRMPPLLWFVDLATLVERMDAGALERARSAATAHGLRGYLEWGIDGARAARAAASGDAASLARLGFRGDERRDAHPALRDLRLADTKGGALRALASWAWPPPLRRDPAAFARRCVARLRRSLVRHPAAAERYGAR